MLLTFIQPFIFSRPLSSSPTSMWTIRFYRWRPSKWFPWGGRKRTFGSGWECLTGPCSRVPPWATPRYGVGRKQYYCARRLSLKVPTGVWGYKMQLHGWCVWVPYERLQPLLFTAVSKKLLSKINVEYFVIVYADTRHSMRIEAPILLLFQWVPHFLTNWSEPHLSSHCRHCCWQSLWWRVSMDDIKEMDLSFSTELRLL